MDNGYFFNELSLNSSIYEEDFFREILDQPSLSSMSDSIINTTTADAGGASVTTTTISSLSSGASQSQHDCLSSALASFWDKQAGTSSSQSSYILSFDNSTIMPATADVNAGYEKHEAANTRASLLKQTTEKNESESKAHQNIRKTRSTSESLDHIMSERKRRQELSEKFIALSATIPGLKKIDKSSVLSEAINYVKKLKERVGELEEQNKKIRDDRESLLMSTINKSPCHHLNAKDNDHHHHHHQDTITSSETLSSSDDKCFKIINQGLPEIEARVLHNQILIRILCEKHNSVMLTILAQLKSLHLSSISSSILNFANSALDITILAEVEEHKIEVKEVVKKLRLAVLETSHNQCNKSNFSSTIIF